jgi:ribulose-phosphate 3-epimerase
MKIIPAINAQTFKEVKVRIDLLSGLTKEFHIDMADGSITVGYQTWQNPIDLEKLDENLQLGLHLMLSLKPQEILKWNNKRIKKFILHLEGANNPDGLLKLAKRVKKEVYIAIPPSFRVSPSISPAESSLDVEKFLPFTDGILVLGVQPGKSGQSFLEETYERIEIIRAKLSKKQKLIVDGGVNENNIEKIIKYQPDFIIINSAIYNAKNPQEAYLRFKEIVLL